MNEALLKAVDTSAFLRAELQDACFSANATQSLLVLPMIEQASRLELAIAALVAAMKADADSASKAAVSAAYEVHNPSFNGTTVQEQIDASVNDWCAEGMSGKPYYGRTKAEAEAGRAGYGDC